MKKIADISSFERLGGQDTASADVSVFNFETTFTVTADSEEGRALLAPLGATEAQFRADITSASQLDKVLRWAGSEGYRKMMANPNFDLDAVFDELQYYYEASGEITPINKYVDKFYRVIMECCDGAEPESGPLFDGPAEEGPYTRPLSVKRTAGSTWGPEEATPWD